MSGFKRAGSDERRGYSSRMDESERTTGKPELLGMRLRHVVFIAIIILADRTKETSSECEFPDFLQSPSDRKMLLPWTTRLWWLNVKDQHQKWVERQEVFVRGGSLWRYREYPTGNCEGFRKTKRYRTATCRARNLLYNRTCLMAAGYNKFRVIEHDPGRMPKFSCMKFLRKTQNVVQVYERVPADTNAPNLCDEVFLEFDDWPWIAPIKKEPFSCPVTGGFTYRTINRLINEDVCKEEWRQSRLEVECVKGDGLDFIAPRGSDCNPFPRKGEWVRLDCWDGWEENNYLYLVVADAGRRPQYCMRFPKKMKREFTIFVYFSVICPAETDGKPPHGIEYYEMQSRRTDPWHCEDDHEKCRDIVRKGKCSKDGSKFILHCPRSCGLCGDDNEDVILCHFAEKLLGTWMLYEDDNQETVVINRTHISFSKLGAFRCDEKNPYKDEYKVSSAFENGCSTRYTCMEFNRRNNNLLQYRLGKIQRINMSMNQLCVFEDGSYPRFDRIWSYHMKNLIQSRNLWPSYCGLESSIPFTGTYNGQYCEGTIADWNENTCITESSFVLKSNTCSALLIPQEFECLAHLDDEDGLIDNLVLTRSKDGKNEFNCWVITSFTGINSTWPYRAIYRMKSVQCSAITDVEVLTTRKARASLYLSDNAQTRKCKPYVTSTRFEWPLSSSPRPVTLVRLDYSSTTRTSHEMSPRESNHRSDKPVVRDDKAHSRSSFHRFSASLAPAFCCLRLLLAVTL